MCGYRYRVCISLTGWLGTQGLNLKRESQSLMCCQLHQSPILVVVQTGIEPVTSALSEPRSNQLSYWTIKRKEVGIVMPLLTPAAPNNLVNENISLDGNGRRCRIRTAIPHPKCGMLPLHHTLYKNYLINSNFFLSISL